MFWKKEKKVHHLMDDYLKEVLTCMEVFQECLLALFEDSTSERSKELVQKVDDAESRADELRDKIEFKLYRKALMPESRGDVLGLVESIDRIPNWAEEVVYDIHLQQVEFPRELLDQFRQLAEMNIQCFDILHKALEALFSDIDAVFALTKELDRKETEIDRFEHDLIRQIVEFEERVAYQSRLIQIVRGLCDISDKIENTGDRLAIVAIKKLV